jgi:hypothetical protein
LQKTQKIIIVSSFALLLFSITVSAENNTTDIPKQPDETETYHIGDITITRDQAIGIFAFIVIMIIIIAWSMKPTKK